MYDEVTNINIIISKGELQAYILNVSLQKKHQLKILNKNRGNG